MLSNVEHPLEPTNVHNLDQHLTEDPREFTQSSTTKTPIINDQFIIQNFKHVSCCKCFPNITNNVLVIPWSCEEGKYVLRSEVWLAKFFGCQCFSITTMEAKLCTCTIKKSELVDIIKSFSLEICYYDFPRVYQTFQIFFLLVLLVILVLFEACLALMFLYLFNNLGVMIVITKINNSHLVSLYILGLMFMISLASFLAMKIQKFLLLKFLNRRNCKLEKYLKEINKKNLYRMGIELSSARFGGYLMIKK